MIDYEKNKIKEIINGLDKDELLFIYNLIEERIENEFAELLV